MYSQQDQVEINGRIKKYAVITAILTAALIAADVVGAKMRIEWLVMVVGALLFIVNCFMWVLYLWPCIRYSIFLKDMRTGLAREMTGELLSMSEEELQDGVRVLPVHILLKEDDERIVYLNASKAEGFPKMGERVHLNCFGRHIKEVSVVA